MLNRFRQLKWIGWLGARAGASSTAAGLSDPLSQIKLVATEFDAKFYAACYPDVEGDLLQHFMTDGWRASYDPAPYFSTEFYLQTYPEISAAGLNPFYHYLQHGRAEGRLVARARGDNRSWEIEAIRTGIDQAFYLGQLRATNIDPGEIDLAEHYLREGASLGLDPARDFSTARYLADHPEVGAAQVNPFAHYLAEGSSEKGAIRSSATGELGYMEDTGVVKNAFDADYYLLAYPDVAAAAANPFTHFMTVGWKEGRNPTSWFDVGDYLELNPDVADAGVNPYSHYLLTGKSEGRLPRHDLGFRYDIIRSLQPMAVRIQEARRATPTRMLTPPEVLRSALQRSTRLEAQGLYISVSHDDYTENFGGIQLVLRTESVAANEMALDHLHLFPSSVIPVVEFDDADPVLGVLLNGARLGFFRSSIIERELRDVAPRVRTRPFAIHSLIRHHAESLAAILKAAGCRAGWFWIHDYSSVCTGYTLLRNDVEFCGGPPPVSQACSLCLYGGLRVKQMRAHEGLFAEFDLTVLAPSETALSVWTASSSIAAPAQVHEHLQIELTTGERGALEPRPVHRPLRVAYVGQAVSHKGWFAFRELALHFRDDRRYQFYHVGTGAQLGLPVIYKEVRVDSDDLDKMVGALRELEIDVAIFWSLWPETFCLAAAEALRAGAALIAYRDSGNIAAMVQRTRFGRVLNSEAELHDLFDTGDVVELATTARATLLTVQFSNMTVDLIKRALA